jgi:hypothetical protein
MRLAARRNRDHKFRREPPFDVLKHELGKLPVQKRTDDILNFVRVDFEGRSL